MAQLRWVVFLAPVPPSTQCHNRNYSRKERGENGGSLLCLFSATPLLRLRLGLSRGPFCRRWPLPRARGAPVWHSLESLHCAGHLQRLLWLCFCPSPFSCMPLCRRDRMPSCSFHESRRFTQSACRYQLFKQALQARGKFRARSEKTRLFRGLTLGPGRPEARRGGRAGQRLGCLGGCCARFAAAVWSGACWTSSSTSSCPFRRGRAP